MCIRDSMLAVAALAQVDQYGVLLAVVEKLINNVQLKLVAIIVCKNDEIALLVLQLVIDGIIRIFHICAPPFILFRLLRLILPYLEGLCKWADARLLRKCGSYGAQARHRDARMQELLMF